jgi:hypothetical protein
MLTYRSDNWPLGREDENVLLRIYVPIKENGVRGSRYNHEIYILYDEPNVTVIKVIKVGPLR